MIPSSIWRASENGRPRRPVGRGSKSSINDHWASDNIWKRDIGTRSQTSPGRFLRHALADGSVAACVSNLPFGRQYDVQGDLRDWMSTVLAELVRVTKPGGRIVLLVPQIPVAPTESLLRDKYTIRLLGTKTAIWVLDRQ